MMVVLASTFGTGCHKDSATPTPSYVSFESESYIFGIESAEEWFEIPIVATSAVEHDRYVGVEIIGSTSSAIRDLHFVLESTSPKIPKGERSTCLRLKGDPESIDIGESLNLTLRLAVESQDTATQSTECNIELRHCCKFDLERFEGYAVLTSTWCMQYMNSNSRLVHTHVEDGNIVVIESMFYDDYDIRVQLDATDRLNPTAGLCGVQVLGSTGEAFGTIYGDGKLLISEAKEYQSPNVDTSSFVSFYSMCEGFMMLYTVMYVEGVGEVGLFGNILEWVSDDEAERIMREGL